MSYEGQLVTSRDQQLLSVSGTVADILPCIGPPCFPTVIIRFFDSCWKIFPLSGNCNVAVPTTCDSETYLGKLHVPQPDSPDYLTFPSFFLDSTLQVPAAASAEARRLWIPFLQPCRLFLASSGCLLPFSRPSHRLGISKGERAG